MLDAGAEGVVSVHLSSRLSGTYEAAELAAAEFGSDVRVVDSMTTGMGLGFAALAAAAAARDDAELDEVRDTAIEHASRVSTLFYVDTLEYLRRGGRIGAAEAPVGHGPVGQAILHVKDGSIIVRDKVRTAGRAMARLVDLAVEASGDGEADIAVHHMGAPERATAVADALTLRLGDRLRDRYITEVGAVVARPRGTRRSRRRSPPPLTPASRDSGPNPLSGGGPPLVTAACQVPRAGWARSCERSSPGSVNAAGRGRPRAEPAGQGRLVTR